jgi:thiamine biosynthesis protein ThiI
LGSEVIKANSDKSITVNLTRPYLEIYVEVRREKAFVFSEKINGPGGLPLGTQGRAVALLSNQNSLIAMWLLMKRGCKIVPVYNKNLNSQLKINPDLEINKLKKWDALLNLRYFLENNIEVSDQFEIKGHTNSEYSAAESLAKKIKAEAVVTGETYEQLNKKQDFGNVQFSIPIFYPMAGLDPNMVTELERKIL